MRLEGFYRLGVAQATVWQALNDPAVLQACVPGCESLQDVGGDRYTVRIAVKVGPVAARFDGAISLHDIDAPNHYTMKFEARGGVAGFGRGTSTVDLATVQDGQCELRYVVDAEVGGRIAQVGQRLIDGVARSMAKQFFTNLEQRIAAFAEPAGEAGPAATSAAPDAQVLAQSKPFSPGRLAAAAVAGVVAVAAVFAFLLA